MAYDGIFLCSIVKELKSKLLNGKIEKINQPEKDAVILHIRNNKNSYKLLISSNSTYPKIHITTEVTTNPLTPPMFCMILRKYLGGAKIIDIKQVTTDRIMIIDFESTDELGFDSIYSLVIEIMGRHSNITLIRTRDNVIMDSIKHITPDMNSVRCVLPGMKFVFPPESNKLNPLDFNYESFKNYYIDNQIVQNEDLFCKMFTGVSKGFSRNYFKGIDEDLQKLFDYCSEIFRDIKEENFIYFSYIEKGTIKDFYCLNLSNYYQNCETKTYNSPSLLIEEFYSEKDKLNRLNSKSSDLQKLINTNIERCTKKIKILENTLIECNDKEKYRTQGELLTANIYNVTAGTKSINVLNYYSDKEEYCEIKLDPSKSPSENIQIYFKKYTKMKKSEEAALIQIENANEELEYLNSVFTSIKNADNYNEIEEIRKELIETSYIKYKKSDKSKKIKASKPMHFISSDGIDIYIGKNNFQNDDLTLKFADKHDIWLHTKNIPGSHVIIRKYGEIPDRTLSEAASLAAYYSKSRESSKVSVDYTEIKNVKKPNGAKPGMVIYYTNKTIVCDPKSPEELKIKFKE